MKLSHNVLNGFIPTPTSPADLRALLDDIGIEVKRMEPSDDHGTIFSVELLANRGDHHGYVGVATEIAGRTGDTLTHPAFTALKVGDNGPAVQLKTDKCLRYTATRMVRGPSTSALSDVQRAPLDAAGTHSINAPIDATNLSQTELGQPTHTFDADTIVGAITIRLSTEGETALPLFAESAVVLPSQTIVIADDEKVLAIAGVIGCESSKTTQDTTNIIIESATFDPVSVRKAARALNLSTDSSVRFERGSDPNAPLVGAGRVATLLQGVGWQIEGDTTSVGDFTVPTTSHKVDAAAASAFIGMTFSQSDISDRLQRYGFTTSDNLHFQVPSHRIWDVEFVADLYEDLAKSIGYNAIPTLLPPIEMGTAPTPAEIVRETVEHVLLSNGLYEVITDGFYGRDLLDRLNIGESHPLFAHIETQNALDRAYSLVKNNNLGQAIEAVGVNKRMRNDQVRIFEWTRTFHPDKNAPNGTCSEKKVLWGLVSGQDVDPDWTHRGRVADPLFVKGMVTEIANELRLPLTLAPLESSHPLSDQLHPGRSASILLHGKPVGFLGEVHPTVLANFKLKKVRPVFFEIAEDALNAAPQSHAVDEPGSLHPILRSLAFTLPNGLSAGTVADYIGQQAPSLNAVNITDLYKHDRDGEPVRTITFELVTVPDAAGVRATDVNEEINALISAVETKFADHHVKLRA
jgi:phenylalanyl-tRNA synthetase beta chain